MGIETMASKNEKTMLLMKVNGRPVEVAVKPTWTLLRVLREELRLTGTKKGCEQGDCGACVVIMNGRTVNSCLVLALQAQSKEIETIEGLGTADHLHPLQKSFIEHGAVQCGFCTPGMLMSAQVLLKENPEPTQEEIKMGISGNLCRCTGYTKIIKAIESASPKR
ncbi:MAG: (2Fe-2S)-binding domain protein [Deltaproteobacteria bacterium]|nr:(2Fe-2S)-binding domain protein [Deltaproteobacteria bacterium]